MEYVCNIHVRQDVHGCSDTEHRKSLECSTFFGSCHSFTIKNHIP